MLVGLQDWGVGKKEKAKGEIFLFFFPPKDISQTSSVPGHRASFWKCQDASKNLPFHFPVLTKGFLKKDKYQP